MTAPSPDPYALGAAGALKFLRAFEAADDDAEVSIGVGTPDKGADYFVTCSVGDVHAALTPMEARKVAQSAEDAMRKYGPRSDGLGLADLILGLRATADRAEQLRRRNGK